MEIQEPETSYIKEQIANSSFGESNSFIQLIDHFRKNAGEFEGRVFGYLTIDMVVANSKIDKPTLFVSDVGDNSSQSDNSNAVVMTRGVEVTFATPLSFKNDYFQIHETNRGENLLNHFLEFKYRLLGIYSSFRPTHHNQAISSINNFKYQGSRFIGIKENVAYYTYAFSYDEKFNMARFRQAECIDNLQWSAKLICCEKPDCEPEGIPTE